MTQDKSLALLVCYYGKLPWYFDYFVNSCKYNPTVDFYVITDDTKWAKTLPGNVKLIYKTMEEVSRLASDKLGLEINIRYPYKLCDLKPAYGLIFSHIFEKYDFWGHCDIDIIFGSIRNFITNDLLEKYDLISVRPEWIPGCFLLYKNIPKMNTLFRHSKDHEKVFTTDKHYCFDETNFAHTAFKAQRSYRNIKTEVESMMHVVKRMSAERYIRPFFDLYMIEGLPGKMKWEKGRMFYRNKYEILLFHLIYFKNIYSRPFKGDNLPDKFTITQNRIYHYNNYKAVVNGV